MTSLTPLTRSALVACALSLSACSFFSESGPAQPINLPEFRSAEIYLSRASLNETEFEHYTFQSGKLFKECGTIFGGRESAEEQTLAPLDESTRIALVTAIDNARAETMGRSFDDPGKSESMIDPGQFFLTVEDAVTVTRLKTSLDAVSTPVDSGARSLKTLTELLRGVAGGRPCGNRAFYGLQSITVEPQKG